MPVPIPPKPLTALFIAGLLALLCIPAGWGLASLGQRSSPLYCIQQRGKVWGVAKLPAEWQPTCPHSSTYRQEVKRGETKVEQYRISGWHPKAALPLLKQSGYLLLTKELDSAAGYSAFLGRQLPGELQYTAIPEGANTIITISGR